MQQHGRCIKTSVFLAVLLTALIFSPVRALAVASTGEPTGDSDTVYVAGNPDWYPVEYYDEDSKSYEGILPELLEKITDETGLEFTYVEAGPEDQRQLLADNKQVEMLSGCRIDEGWLKDADVTPSQVMLSIPAEEGQIEVCFAFTEIADETLISRIEGAISEITEQEVSGICM